jgi:tRNA threonylcarbamoyladenosine biosynthesis protein TsaB
VDTCGAAGSVGLGLLDAGRVTLLGERTIAGGEFAARLVPVVAGLLAELGLKAGGLAGIVAVAGPGSFTGIRIGLALVKALAEANAIPVVTLSRLALLAHQAQTPCAVLDAHRGQIFCGFFPTHGPAREMLLTAGEVNAMGGLRGRVGVCEEAVAQFLETLLGEPEPDVPGEPGPLLALPELVRVPCPTAAAALPFSLAYWERGELADLAALDGHYLRGADAKVLSGQGGGLA